VYRGIASLLVYLIVAQDRREVTVHFRDESGSRHTRRAQGLDSIVPGRANVYAGGRMNVVGGGQKWQSPVAS